MSNVRQRELEHHEKLYGGFAQEHFAKPAVRALRAHMVSRILYQTEAAAQSRILSLGCGIGDTELLLAPYVGEIAGIDLSPAAIRQAREDADRRSVANAHFFEASLEEAPFEQGRFDAIVGIFLLHHVPDLALAARRAAEWLRAGGVFYGLDPSRYRLSGAAGRLLVPRLMKRYRTPDERELRAADVERIFRDAGFAARTEIYDFISSPLAGLLPAWGKTYLAARIVDDWLIRVPGLRRLGSNFELIARKPPQPS